LAWVERGGQEVYLTFAGGGTLICTGLAKKFPLCLELFQSVSRASQFGLSPHFRLLFGGQLCIGLKPCVSLRLKMTK